jgi:hypothetical protein
MRCTFVSHGSIRARPKAAEAAGEYDGKIRLMAVVLREISSSLHEGREEVYEASIPPYLRLNFAAEWLALLPYILLLVLSNYAFSSSYYVV